MATKSKKNNSNPSTVDMLKTKAADINKLALKTSDEVVEETIAVGEQWQNILAKALKKGTKLFGMQQEMVLDGLEMLKDQYNYGNKRFKKLVAVKPSDSKKAKPTTKKTAAAAKTGKSIDQVMDAALKTEAPAKKAAKPATAKATKPRTVAPKAKVSSVTTAKATSLTTIEGIGPKIQELLNKAGIVNLDQLAAASPADLKKVLTDAGTRYQMHDPSTWAAQAKLAAAGKMDELNVLKAELKGGK